MVGKTKSSQILIGSFGEIERCGSAIAQGSTSYYNFLMVIAEI
nr:MAG TPA: hypothetical protein [Caudoviricetes sp.]